VQHHLVQKAPFQREELNNIFRYQVITLGITLILITLLFMLLGLAGAIEQKVTVWRLPFTCAICAS